VAIGFLTDGHVRALHAVAERLAARGLAEESAELRRVLDEVEQPPAHLDAASAVAILYVPEQVIRNWVRAGLLPGWQDEQGGCFVERAALDTAIEMRQAFEDDAGEPVSDEEVDRLIAEVRAERRARSGRR
jgi:hypothetical protein